MFAEFTVKFSASKQTEEGVSEGVTVYRKQQNALTSAKSVPSITVCVDKQKYNYHLQVL